MTRAHRVLAGLLFAATLAAFLPASARAEPVSAADTQAVRAVVETLAAFAEDDGQRLLLYRAVDHEYSSPGASWRWCAAATGRLPAERGGLSPSGLGAGQLVQGVHLPTPAALWLAVCQLERQPDKSWRMARTCYPSVSKMP
jgi:hypothetical protein